MGDDNHDRSDESASGTVQRETTPVAIAAERVLRDAQKPLHYREITKQILARGQSRLRSKTPENSVNAILAVDIQDNPSSKFKRFDRGIYGLSEWQNVPAAPQPATSSSPDPVAQLVDECVKRYRREFFAFERLAGTIEDACWKLLDQHGVMGQVQSRAKVVGSFAKKIRRYLSNPAEATKLKTPDDVFARIGDIAGVRVLTYVEADRPKMVELIRGEFADVVIEEKNKIPEGKFYRATHCQVTIKPENAAEQDEPLIGMPCEIQVCSMLAHVWNEIEHDLDYKPEDALTDGERALLQALGYQTIAGDTVISQLLQTIAQRRNPK